MLSLTEKTCVNCEQTKPIDDFVKSGFRNGRQAYVNYCKKCHRERNTKGFKNKLKHRKIERINPAARVENSGETHERNRKLDSKDIDTGSEYMRYLKRISECG